MNERSDTNNCGAMLAKLITELSKSVSSVVVGQEEIVRSLVGAFLTGGHVLLEGPPGIGKTLLARTVARAVGLSFSRIQFTPDLMPSDITGVSIFDQQSASFRFVPGPLFADVVLADEINRTPPKTQAALLEAMEEHSVTSDGVRRPLSDLFFVVATQNPIEYEGTFPLPEAQLDRFHCKLIMSYPTAADEAEMIEQLSGAENKREFEITPTVSAEILREARVLLREIQLTPTLAHYIRDIVQAIREHPSILLGISPRGALALALGAKVRAAFVGRSYTVPDDVQAAAHATLSHRMILRPEIYDERVTTSTIISEVLEKVAVPDVV